tara:strand:- start:278 stop:565 length:288 start_codon:yes stop_codon:yes gene_type:complete
MGWRDDIDTLLKPHLEAQLKESLRYKDAFKKAPDPRNAQLWCAIARLSQQNYVLKGRLKKSEELILRLIEDKVSKTKSSKEKKELQELIDTMQKF